MKILETNLTIRQTKQSESEGERKTALTKANKFPTNKNSNRVNRNNSKSKKNKSSFALNDMPHICFINNKDHYLDK
jgi:hypothetical protein